MPQGLRKKPFGSGKDEFKLKSKYSTYAHIYTLLLLLLCAFAKGKKPESI